MNRGFILLLVVAFLFGGGAVLLLRGDGSGPAAPASDPASQDAPEATPLPETSLAEKTAEPARTAGKPRLLILAASWEPAFCETAPNKLECRTLHQDRWDAAHFSLHGLWPPGEYCGVTSAMEQHDRDGRWSQLHPVELPASLQAQLDQTMPGTRSQLERHEWLKHGTCYGGTQADYFADTLDLMAALNASAVRDLFAANIGRELSQARIRDAFDTAFGAGAGDRVRIACETDGNREIISELTIGLYAPSGVAPDFRTAVHAANPTRGGCLRGIVDPAGNQ